jgi:hypothetical protein
MPRVTKTNVLFSGGTCTAFELRQRGASTAAKQKLFFFQSSAAAQAPPFIATFCVRADRA